MVILFPKSMTRMNSVLFVWRRAGLPEADSTYHLGGFSFSFSSSFPFSQFAGNAVQRMAPPGKWRLTTTKDDHTIVYICTYGVQLYLGYNYVIKNLYVSKRVG